MVATLDFCPFFIITDYGRFKPLNKIQGLYWGIEPLILSFRRGYRVLLRK